jgi:hypothetical protein
MKTRLTRRAVAVSALLGLLLLAFTPAFADTALYDNGPINGTLSAWTINNGFSVADSFTLSNASTVSSFSAGLWLFPGDVPTSASWAIISGVPFSSEMVLASGNGNFTNTLLPQNSFGFDLYTSLMGIPSVSLGAGTYYLELYNASTPSGDPIYWDINNGSSTAYENTLGNVNDNLFPGTNSEAFTINGTATTAATPEPGTCLMFGTGALGLMGALRRRFSI